MQRDFGNAGDRPPRLRDEAVYQRMYAESLRDPDAFWSRAARELRWLTPCRTVLDSSDPRRCRWFVGGELNATQVCLDHHVDMLDGGRRAVTFQGDDGEKRTLSYTELHVEVVRLANVLTHLGIQAGERVAIHLPRTPEWVTALLACARIGAVHVVLDARSAAARVRECLRDCACRAVITADGGFAGGRPYEVKSVLEAALVGPTHVRDVIVVRRTGRPAPWVEGRDRWFHELVADVADTDAPRGFDAGHPLSITYGDDGPSGPRGLVHATAGFVLAAYLSAQYHLDLGEGDLLTYQGDEFGAASAAYSVYGPLACGSTVQLLESDPRGAGRGEWFEQLALSHPTAAWISRKNLSALVDGPNVSDQPRNSPWRVLATEGGPCTPLEQGRVRACFKRFAWVDGWGNDATGTLVLAPLPGLDPVPSGSTLRPFFGIDPRVVGDDGQEVVPGTVGHLVLARPWPGFACGQWGDPDGFVARHWERHGGGHFATGVLAHHDADGELWIDGPERTGTPIA